MLLGTFALLWGVQVVLVRLWAAEPSEGRGFLLASQAFLLPLYLLLAQFVAVFPRRLRVSEARWWLPVLALPAAAWLTAIAVQPEAVLQGSDPSAGIVWGWANLVFTTPPFIGCLAFAVVRFGRGYLLAREPLLQQQLRLCALALLAYVTYWLCWLAALSPRTWPTAMSQYGLGPTLVYYGAIAGGLAVVLATTVTLVARTEGHRRWTWAGVAGAAALVAIPTAQLDAGGGVLGMFRLLMVGLLAYAVAKHRLFDVDLRLRSTARVAAAAAIGLAVWGLLATVAWYVLSVRWPEQPLPFVAMAGVGALAAFAAWPRVVRFFDAQFPYIRATEEYLLRRKLEVYRAAVDADVPEDRRSALARELKLKPWERRVLDQPTNGRASPLAPGALLAKRYRLSRFLGPGMYGRVFLAQDERVGEPVVLKEYAGFGGPGAAEAFAREAKTLGSLDHRNVLAVRDVFRAGEDMYIALEHAPDGSLEERLAKGALPEAEAIDLALQLLAGLAAAHKKGIVHRDVKPGNALFRGKVLKLADFGVAFDPVFDGALRAAAAQPGTLAWMAPEQALGKGADKASDVYAAGAVLYRMLAGRHYLDLEGKGEQAVRRAIAERAPRLPLAGVSDQANAVLARALAKEPGERYPDAAAMLRDVRAPWRPASAPQARPTAGRAYGTP